MIRIPDIVGDPVADLAHRLAVQLEGEGNLRRDVEPPVSQGLLFRHAAELTEDDFDPAFERRKIDHRRVPDLVVVDAKVLVYDYVSHRDDIRPGKARKPSAQAR